MKNVKKGIRKILAMALSMCMIAGCLAMVPVGGAKAATPLSINYTNVSEPFEEGSLNFRSWNASVTGDSGTYSGKIQITMTTYNSATNYDMQLKEKGSTSGFSLTNNGITNTLTGTINVSSKTTGEIQNYLNTKLYINNSGLSPSAAASVVKIANIDTSGMQVDVEKVKVYYGVAEGEDNAGAASVTIDGKAVIPGNYIEVEKGKAVDVVVTPASNYYVSGYKLGGQDVTLTGSGAKTITLNANQTAADITVYPAFSKVESEVKITDRQPGNLEWAQVDADNKLSYKEALQFNYNAAVTNYMLNSYFGKSWTYGVDLLSDPAMYSIAGFDGAQDIKVGTSEERPLSLGTIGGQAPKQGTNLDSQITKQNVKPGIFRQTVTADYYTATSICGNHWYHVGGVVYHKDGMNRTIEIAKDTLSIAGLGATYTYGSNNNATVVPATAGMDGSKAQIDNAKLRKIYKDSKGNVVSDITKAVPGEYTVEFTYDGDDYIDVTSGLSQNFTITKAQNTAIAVAPAATKTNNSIILDNLEDGQVYSIDGKKWYTKEEIDEENPFVNLEEGTEYTVFTKIAATDTYEESEVNAATKVTTDVTISGRISGDAVALPAIVTITDGGESYTVTTDENGNYSIVVPVGTYSILVEGEDGLQAGSLTSFAASKTNKEVPIITMTDTAKGTAKKFVESELGTDDGIITEVTQDTLDQILESNDVFNNITVPAVKAAINDWMESITDPAKKYEELVAEAKEFLNETTNAFIEMHMTDEEDNIIIEATRETYANILGGETDFNNLTKAQKDEVNRKLKGAGAQPDTYEGLLAKAKELIEEEANNFIGTYVSDEEGNIYLEATAENYEQILSGKEEWDALSQSEKDAIDAKLVAAGSKPYEELLARAQEILEKSDSFVKTYVSDKDGNIYPEATAENYEQILSGKEEWDALSQSEKDAIDAKLVAAGSKPYEELLARAQEIKEKSDSFVKTYVSDKEGNIYPEATAENYEQILSGKEEWDALSQSEKDAIDAKLVAAGSKPYEELLARAQEIKEKSDSFVKTYVSDKDGNVYKKVTKDNYEQILSGKAVWDKLTQEEKDAIDAKLVAAGSKPYLELLKEAEALKKSTDNFIKKYVSDDKGNIYKTATKSNYKQILSGKAEWNKKSQAEKDAINAILVANGGKTYEELLKLAEKIAADVAKTGKTAKTGDSAPIAFYLLLMMLSMTGAAVVERKRRMI